MNFTQEALDYATSKDPAAVFIAGTLSESLAFVDGLPEVFRAYALAELGLTLREDSCTSSEDSCSKSSSIVEDGSDSDSSHDEDNDPDIPMEGPPKMCSPRRYTPGPPVEESHWFVRFLAPNVRDNCLDETHRTGLEFRSLFSVPFAVFEVLVHRTVSRGWYDPCRRNSAGRLCSDVRLLILGALHKGAQNASFQSNQSSSNISKAVHRIFTHVWRRQMAASRDEFISMPDSRESLDFITSDYEKLLLPGCAGSMDIVHRGWDRCPAAETTLFEGKEGYPSIAFEVIVSHRRYIMYVSLGYPGARNDKQIVKVDEFPVSLHRGSHWLRSQVWFCSKQNGHVVTFRGHWLVVDGGYLRWPSLICPVSNDPNKDVTKLGKHLETVRKDVECTFGSLKKRFKCLKAWSELASMEDLENEFVTCCILHNMLLEYDGYLDSSYEPDISSAGRGDGLWQNQQDKDISGATASEDEAVTNADEGGWMERIIALAENLRVKRSPS